MFSFFRKKPKEEVAPDLPFLLVGDVVRFRNIYLLGDRDKIGDFALVVHAPVWHALGPHPRPVPRYVVLTGTGECVEVVIGTNRFGVTMLGEQT